MPDGDQRMFHERAAQPGEADACRATTARVPLRDLLFIGPPRDCIGRRLELAQLEAALGFLPLNNLVNVAIASLVAWALRSTVAASAIGLWFAGLVVLAIARVVLSRRFAAAPDRALAVRPTVLALTLVIVAAGMLWAVLPLHWFDFADQEQRLLILVAVLGLICGSTIVLATVPPAAFAYVLTMSGGIIVVAIEHNLPLLAAMAAVFAAALLCAGLWLARHYVTQLRARLELEEQRQLVELLREFEASGSGWIWELDADLRLTYMSNDQSRWSVRRVSRLLGQDVRTIMDPSGRIAQVSEGVRTLFAHFALQTEFRDIAVPTAKGRWWSVSGKPIYDEEGRFAGWRGLGSDITDVRIHGHDAVSAARRDPLTGVGNRLLVREQIEDALLRENGGCAVMLVDLDRFKLVNDTLGHSFGDLLLNEVAARLNALVGDKALVGRLGGDEFAIAWPVAADRGTLSRVADQMIAELSATYVISGVELNVGATVGIAIAPDDGQSQDELIRSADLALYRAKEGGRGTHQFYAQWMSERARANRQLESDLRQALQKGELSLVYQPIVSASGGTVIGYEALLRWRHPTQGDIAPDRFVPIIEDIGLINQIGGWVIREACAEAAGWPVPHRIAVNVSAAQVTGTCLLSTVVNALAASGLAADRLEIEVTESVFLGDDEATLASLARLRGLGVRLVIDDFGKGYSSFGYLSRARFSKIKIDQSFVRGAAEGDREHLAIVEAILALAHRLDVETTAEGVETLRQERVMRSLGCEQFQGFRFGRPVPASVFREAAGGPLRRIA